jgi:hypothetical protein
MNAMRIISEPDNDEPHLNAVEVDKPRAFSSNVHRKQEVGKRASHIPASQKCLSAIVEFCGVKARAMFDSGSTTDCVSPDLVRLSDAPTFLLQDPVTLQLGCVGSRSKINYGSKAAIEIGGVKAEHYFDVVNLDKYDMIVGVPFLRRFGIVINFETNQILMKGKPLPLFLTGEGVSATEDHKKKSIRERFARTSKTKDKPKSEPKALKILKTVRDK